MGFTGVGAALGTSALRAEITAAGFLLLCSGPEETNVPVLPCGRLRLSCWFLTSPFRPVLGRCYHSQLCGSSLSAPCQPLCLAFSNLFLNWIQCNWLGFIYLKLQLQLNLFLRNDALVPLIGVLSVPSPFSHTSASFGLFSDGLIHMSWWLYWWYLVGQMCFWVWLWVPPLLPCFLHVWWQS